MVALPLNCAVIGDGGHCRRTAAAVGEHRRGGSSTEGGFGWVDHSRLTETSVVILRENRPRASGEGTGLCGTHNIVKLGASKTDTRFATRRR